jgi:PQQ-dependent catabolism-associated beta-propeller protein
MAVSHDGRWAVTTSETTNMVHWIDTASHGIVANTLVGQRPRYARFSADDKLLWVTSEIGGTVAVIDVASQTVLHEIGFSIPGVPRELVQPVGLRLSRDGGKAFVALGPANRVAVVDTASYAVEKYLLVGRRVWQLDLTPDGGKLFTTNGLTNDVSIIDVASLEVVKSTPVGRMPWGVAVRP